MSVFSSSAQTVLTNGAETAGALLANSTNTYSFDATNGDAILLRIGAPVINPRIVLYGPGGVVVASAGSGVTGAHDVSVAVQGTNTGSFTVEVSSVFSAAGSYLLNLAKIPGNFVVSPGDEGGPLTNGWKYGGTNDLGDLDMWSFAANAGDSIVLHMGAATFNPGIRLYGPTGTLVGSAGSGASGVLVADLAVAATNSGTFTVVSSSFTGNGTGGYSLTLAQSPGAIFVAPGDEGGSLTNGWKHGGVIDLGDLDVWSFSANAGDNLVLRMGSTNFNPWIRLYGPTGTLLGSAGTGAAGALMEEIAVLATNSGSFTVVATSIGNGTGNYVLNFARSPGAIFVAPGDEGGPLTNGWQHTGNIDLGDLDMWSFNASAGDSILLRMGSSSFNPSIRLYGPTGTLLGSAGSGASGALVQEIALQSTNTGTFMVVATAIGIGTGAYLLNLAQSPGAFFVTPGDQGGPLTNGWQHIGTINLGALEMWSFDANPGDSILLRMGSTNFNPWIRLYGPTGTLLGSAGSGAAGALVQELTLQATNSGAFTVVATAIGLGTGSYQLNLAQSPGAFIITPGDQGGPLTNGWQHTGTIDLGELNMWSFDANPGDNIVLRIGSTNFNPWIRLYGPTGTLLGSAGSGASGALVQEITFQATNSGSFIVVATGIGIGTGAYLLNLAQLPGTFFVAPGDEGGPLTNGWKHTGIIDLGDLDLWSFDANAGDSIVLRMGSATFNPWIRLYGPTGTLVGSAGSGASGALIPELDMQAPTSGAFTVVVTAFGDGTGPYLLNMAKTPGAIFVAPGDEGGVMTNGWKYTGTMDTGDLDAWTFPANPGDTILLRMASPIFNPLIRLYGPTGTLIASAGNAIAGSLDVNLASQATDGGSYTVVASTFSSPTVGNYLINLAKIPGDFFVAPNDEGGTLISGINQNGTIDPGDMDMWRFAGCHSQPVIVSCQKLSGTNFTPRIRLFNRSGVLLATAANASLATINYSPTNADIYTAIVDGANVYDSGTYLLNGNGLSDEMNICLPVVFGTNLDMEVVGGASNATFVVYTTTNVTVPFVQWSPILTNQFDQFGVSEFTNVFDPLERQRYFRVQAQ